MSILKRESRQTEIFYLNKILLFYERPIKANIVPNN